MGQAQINVRTRACSRTSIARTRQAALTHNVRGKELNIDNAKLQMRFVHYAFFYLKGNFLAELNEICCGSLLNSILQTYRRKFL